LRRGTSSSVSISSATRRPVGSPERDAARAAKDFATSDRLRDALVAMGLEVMDTAEGTKIRPRD
jgi:cysteinyl-tRNA synthetase